LLETSVRKYYCALGLRLGLELWLGLELVRVRVKVRVGVGVCGNTFSVKLNFEQADPIKNTCLGKIWFGKSLEQMLAVVQESGSHIHYILLKMCSEKIAQNIVKIFTDSVKFPN